MPPFIANSVFVSGTLAYVADYWTGLRVIDVSDPTQPREVGFYETPGLPMQVFAADSLIYLADYWGGLWILRYTGDSHSYSVSGQVELQDFSGDVTTVPVTVELRQSGNVVRTEVISLDAQGGFTLYQVAPGTYEVAFKASHWLRRVRTVEVIGSNVQGVNVSLPNGDVDGDNEVTLFDFSRLVAAFGSMPGDSNWNPDADLDGDEEVTLYDFGIIVRHFGEAGDW